MAKKKKQPDPSDPRLVAFREWRYAVDRVKAVEEQMEQLGVALNRDKADMQAAYGKLAATLAESCLVVNGTAYTEYQGMVVDMPALVISEAKQ